MKFQILLTLCTVFLLGIGQASASAPSDSNPAKTWDASAVSGTLPVLYVNTEGGVPIVDKVTQISASLWIEVPEACDQKDLALGSAEEPLGLVIRGRGNSTWQNDKKPYKLKFNSKTPMMGMPKHKHFALLALAHGHRDWSAYNCGLEFARYMNLGWTPAMKPVEFVLNGEYLGLYWVIESIKIGENRLNIYEQPDINEDDDTIPYGWLVEIDNTEDDCQIMVKENEDHWMRVTYHSPEELSDKQESWLTGSFTKICETIYSDDEAIAENWDRYLDPYSLAKCFIIRELNSDLDGFAGSVYLHRDKTDDAKWVFGPIWDCAMSTAGLSAPTDWYINTKPEWRHWHLIEQIFKTKKFQDVFLEVWNNFYPEGISHIHEYMKELSGPLMEVNAINNERWNIDQVMTPTMIEWLFDGLYNRKAKWIEEHKYFNAEACAPDIAADSAPDIVSELWFDLSGSRIDSHAARGLYIRRVTLRDGSVRTSKVSVTTD